jgi:hypothetical protein
MAMPLFTRLVEDLYDDLHEEGRISDEDYKNAKRKLHREYVWHLIWVTAIVILTIVALLLQIFGVYK